MWGFWILVLLILLLLAAIPRWPYSRGWGYTPLGVVAAATILWLVLIWLGFILLALPWGVAPAPPPVAG